MRLAAYCVSDNQNKALMTSPADSGPRHDPRSDSEGSRYIGDAFMTAPLSQDIRVWIVGAVDAESSVREVARRFEVSPSAAIKLMQRVRKTVSAAPARIGGYQQPILAGQENYLRELTRTRNGITLSEIKAAFAERGIAVSKSATWTMPRQLGLSHEKS